MYRICDLNDADNDAGGNLDSMRLRNCVAWAF